MNTASTGDGPTPRRDVNGVSAPILPVIVPTSAPRSVDEAAGGTIGGAPIGIVAPVALQVLGIVALVVYGAILRVWTHATTADLQGDPIIMTIGVYLTGNILVTGGTAVSHMFAVRGVVARAYVQQGVHP